MSYYLVRLVHALQSAPFCPIFGPPPIDKIPALIVLPYTPHLTFHPNTSLDSVISTPILPPTPSFHLLPSLADPLRNATMKITRIWLVPDLGNVLLHTGVNLLGPFPPTLLNQMPRIWPLTPMAQCTLTATRFQILHQFLYFRVLIHLLTNHAWLQPFLLAFLAFLAFLLFIWLRSVYLMTGQRPVRLMTGESLATVTAWLFANPSSWPSFCSSSCYPT